MTLFCLFDATVDGTKVLFRLVLIADQTERCLCCSLALGDAHIAIALTQIGTHNWHGPKKKPCKVWIAQRTLATNKLYAANERTRVLQTQRAATSGRIFYSDSNHCQLPFVFLWLVCVRSGSHCIRPWIYDRNKTRINVENCVNPTCSAFVCAIAFRLMTFFSEFVLKFWCHRFCVCLQTMRPMFGRQWRPIANWQRIPYSITLGYDSYCERRAKSRNRTHWYMRSRRNNNENAKIEHRETEIRCDVRLMVNSVLRLFVSAADAVAACGVTASSISFHRRKHSMLGFVSHRFDDDISAYRLHAKMPRCECVSPWSGRRWFIFIWIYCETTMSTANTSNWISFSKSPFAEVYLRECFFFRMKYLCKTSISYDLNTHASGIGWNPNMEHRIDRFAV